MGLQIHKYTNTQIHKYTNTQLCSYTAMYKYTETKKCSNNSTDQCGPKMGLSLLASYWLQLQIHSYAALQLRIHVCIHRNKEMQKRIQGGPKMGLALLASYWLQSKDL